jgi:hypothetical protein
MSDKSRKDFEAWAMTTGFEDHHFALRDDGEYANYDVRRLFAPWQASRAAIEVEMPKSTEFSRDDYPGYVIDRCGRMIAAQGLKVKA